MKKLFILFYIFIFAATTAATAQDTKIAFDLSSIGFHKRSEIPAELQIRNIFDNYQKYTNTKNLEAFLNLHDDNYQNSDGYDKTSLKKFVTDAWKDFPDVRYSIKVLSVNVDIDNATVITSERLSGYTSASVDYIKGNGYVDSESTSIYYLKRFSNDWRIVSEFVVNEKTAIRYGAARYIPMQLDAPALVAPEEEYTAIIKMNVPRKYVALVSLNNEPITYPLEKSTEVFRGIKADGIRERILISNNGLKNENAIASIGIAKPDIKEDSINVNLVGIAFLSTRVNVVKHKYDFSLPAAEKSVTADIKSNDNLKEIKEQKKEESNKK